MRPGVCALVCAALFAAGCASPRIEDGPPSEPQEHDRTRRGLNDDGASGGAGNATESAPDDERSSAPAKERFAGCSGEGPVTFTVSPMRAEDFESIIPYGLLAGAHVTPIDHMYLSPPFGSARDAFEVFAIADGVIYNVQPRDIKVDTGEAREREWRMDIAHTCTFTSYFDLLTSLEPAIEAAYNETQAGRTGPWRGIPIRAGERVGRIGGQTLDFGVYDYNVTLPGFIVPEHYDREPWKVHTVDPFPYFAEPPRTGLTSKNLRVAEPRAGRIDYDVDGRAVGNWFLAGSNGYNGTTPHRYWDGHLAFMYDHLDPTQIRFSIGNWTPGREASFGIRGNAPDPANLSVESGAILVELVRYDYYAENDPGRRGVRNLRPGDTPVAENLEGVQGVALLLMLEPRLLKVEVFPGKTAGEIAGFTEAARLYER